MGQLAAIGRQGLAGQLHELGGGDVAVAVGILLADHIPRLAVAGGIVRVLLQHGASDQRAHVELVELIQPAAAFCFHGGAHRIEVALLPQPEAEARLGHLLGHANRLEQDRQHGLAHGVFGAGGHGAAGGHQRFAASGGEGVEFPELSLHLIR